MPHSLSRRGFLAAAAAIPIARLTFAQQPQETASSNDTTFSTDVKVVNVLATVHDKSGKVVSILGKDDFDLAEDGRPQKILYFSRDTDLPLTLGLLVDTSLSQRDVLSDERRSSYRFLETVLREDKDHAFVIHFDREVEPAAGSDFVARQAGESAGSTGASAAAAAGRRRFSGSGRRRRISTAGAGWSGDHALRFDIAGIRRSDEETAGAQGAYSADRRCR